MDISATQLSEAWGLLHRIGRGMMPQTANRLFCDYFRIVSNQSNQLIKELIDGGHLRWEPGWLELTGGSRRKV